jgi:lactoylglutathione lyase
MSDVMRVHHVALWVRNLERMRAFYVDVLGGQSGPLYENPRTGLRSYFVSFSEGARVELMTRTFQSAAPDVASGWGYAHIALSVGSRAAVDETIARLKDRGVTVFSAPRTTGDGYYEAVVEDPEGNKIEIVE